MEVDRLMFTLLLYAHISISNSIFELRLELLSEVTKMGLKFPLRVFQLFRLECKEKVESPSEWRKIAINFRFEAQGVAYQVSMILGNLSLAMQKWICLKIMCIDTMIFFIYYEFWNNIIFYQKSEKIGGKIE